VTPLRQRMLEELQGRCSIELQIRQAKRLESQVPLNASLS